MIQHYKSKHEIVNEVDSPIKVSVKDDLQFILAIGREEQNSIGGLKQFYTGVV